MLKRQHFQLKEWQVEYLEFAANRYGTNKSEVLRTDINIAVIVVAKMHGYKTTLVDPKNMMNLPDKKIQRKIVRQSKICREGVIAIRKNMERIEREACSAAEFMQSRHTS